MSQELYRPAVAEEPSPALVAHWTGGRLHDHESAPQALTGLATLDTARPTDMSFVTDKKAAAAAKDSPAGLLIVPAGCPGLEGRARLEVPEVWTAVARVMEELYPQPWPAPGVHPTAVVGEGTQLGDDVSIGAHCVLGEGCVIGARTALGPHCILEPGTTVGEDCHFTARVTCMGRVMIGDRVTIHPGAVLGADGFAFKPVGGDWLKIPQVGAVIIEDDVEIGAGTTIDRAFLHETRVGRGTKLDNMVQIAHNVQVGAHCVMAAKVGIAGSSRLGDWCMLGGNAGLADGITVGNQCVIGANSGVHSDWPDGSQIIGSPAMPMRQFWRVAAATAKLPDYVKRLRELERQLEALQAKGQEDGAGLD